MITIHVVALGREARQTPPLGGKTGQGDSASAAQVVQNDNARAVSAPGRVTSVAQGHQPTNPVCVFAGLMMAYD